MAHVPPSDVHFVPPSLVKVAAEHVGFAEHWANARDEAAATRAGVYVPNRADMRQRALEKQKVKRQEAVKRAEEANDCSPKCAPGCDDGRDKRKDAAFCKVPEG